ncbi:MAG: MarR family transcriptional regulator [Lachnospiraceae bacterium]|nr:MarR family transcriptional regulator [Lachnospiraceae bacterium]
MLQKCFTTIYSKFKLYSYQHFFGQWKEREVSLTTVETFCMEIIYNLGTPTVNEFAKMANISSANAAYKINNLVKKGYLRKVQSEEDRREFHLEVTDRYKDYCAINQDYLMEVMRRVKDKLSEEELKEFERYLTLMSNLMTEVQIKENE